MNTTALSICVLVDEWTTEKAIIANNVILESLVCKSNALLLSHSDMW